MSTQTIPTPADAPKPAAPAVKLVKVEVDGVPVLADSRDNLIEAARRVNVAIPYFCYHPRLESVGACRMCLANVELEQFGMRRLGSPRGGSRIVGVEPEGIELINRFGQSEVEKLLPNAIGEVHREHGVVNQELSKFAAPVDALTTVNAQLATLAERGFVCVFSRFCVDRRISDLRSGSSGRR